MSDFSGTPVTGEVPLTVNFTDASTGNKTSWAWDFGDGGTSTDQNPTRQYTLAGSYTVALTVTGPGGSNTNTRAAYIVAVNPTAKNLTLAGPSSGAVNLDSSQFVVATDLPIKAGATIVVTPNDGGAGGTFSPATLSLTPVSPTGAFTYRPASSGSRSIALANNSSLGNPTAISFSAIAVSWPFAIAENTWGLIPASNTLAALNPDNDATVNPNFPGAAPWRGGGRFGGMFTAWCGAAWDEAGGRLWWTDAGGHGDQWDNGVYKLELVLQTPKYTRVLNPSGSVGLPAVLYPETAGALTGDYSDGRGRPVHTYNYPFYIPGTGPGLASAIGVSPTGVTPPNPRLTLFDETTGARTVKSGDVDTRGSGAAACWDSKRKVVWKRPNGTMKMGFWDPSTNLWTSVGVAQGSNGPWSLTYIPGLDVILMGNGDDQLGQTVAGGWQVFDPATGNYHNPTFTGAPALGVANPNGLWPGQCQPRWSASLNKVLAWDNSTNTTKIMTLTPGANPRTDAWVIGELPVAAGNSVTPSVAVVNGTYGRFFVWDAARICGVINDVTETGFFFRYSTAPTPPVTPLPPAPTGKYRTTQTYLFQGVPASVIASRLAGGSDYGWDVFGPTYQYVDFQAGWPWSRAGGDWIDKNAVRYGTTPWSSIPVNKASGGSAIASYTGDVTALVQYVQTKNRWNALYIECKNAPRAIASNFNKANAAPSIAVTYANGKTATLACRVVAVNDKSAFSSITTSADVALPAFIEFERPTSAVTTATISFVVTQHWSGSNPTLDVYLLDPPLTPDSGPIGVAASAGKLDLDVDKQPGVLGAHRYLDGQPLSAFTFSGIGSITSEQNYDPAIFGRGATDLTKLPHAGLGKWIGADAKSWSKVDSSYTGEGFQPLAPGMGAIRIFMPADPVASSDGAIVGSTGTGVSNAMIFLPESEFGLLGRIFVRYYLRLGTPLVPTAAKRYQVYNVAGGTPQWTTMAGKFAIAPDHSTSYGGVSGTSGGGFGWQMRGSWYECDAGVAGPDEGGWSVGFHLFDFQSNNPTGYQYGNNLVAERWGQIGGVGGILYAGQWYCVETELKLNSVSASGLGFTPDGELRTWIDGRMVYERTGMVFRSLPLVAAAYDPSQIRPCRELGVRGLWLNWFHGGKTLATIDRTSFYTGLVWGKQYIGPMQL